MATKKKVDNEPRLLAFTMAQEHLLTMIGRCEATDAKKILLSTKSPDPTRNEGELTITAVGHPLTVVTRTWSSDGVGFILVHADGQCVMNLSDLKRLVQAMPRDLLDVSCTTSMKFRLEAVGHADKPKTRSFMVHALKPEDYPPVPTFPAGGPTRTLPGPQIKTAIERVRYAADDADAKEIYSAVMLALDTDHLEAIGTSGRCLAKVTLKAPLGEPGELLIPRPMLSLVCHLGETAKDLHFAADEARIYLDTEQTMASCLKPIGVYPPWKQVLEALRSQAVSVCKLDSPQLGEALRALLTVWHLSYMDGDDKQRHEKRGAPVDLRLEGNMLYLSAGFEPAGTKLASSDEELEVGNTGKFTMHTMTEATLLARGATQAAAAVSLLCDPRDPLSPLCLETEDQTFLSITMPLRPTGG